MAKSRPRLSDTDYEVYKQKKITDSKVYRVLFASDYHGWLVDLKAARVVNKILQHNKFDEVCLNGDTVDLCYLSAHNKRLYGEGILKGYTEVGELEYTRDQILAPIRQSTKAKIKFRLGNHCNRIVTPNLLGKSQLANLAVVHKHFNTTELDQMLSLKEMDIDYDPTPSCNYFGIFECVHGLSLAKTASEKNIMAYMGSGTSGHTHRLSNHYITNKKGDHAWFQSGCLRIREEVEYLPTGIIADWALGCVVVTFYEESPGKYMFFGETIPIVNYKAQYNGVIYDGNKN